MRRHFTSSLRWTRVVLALTLAAAFGPASHAAPRATKNQHSVALKWDASKTPVLGYNVYRATKAGGPYKKLTYYPLTLPEYTDTNVKAGKTYFYAVTTVLRQRVESSKSAEIRATIPKP